MRLYWRLETIELKEVNKVNEEPSCGHHKTLTPYHVTVYDNNLGKES
jgi:hypothetical protein